MRSSIQFRALAGILVVGSLVLATAMPSSAEVDMYDGHWRFTVAPYLWFPTINGTLGLTAPNASGGGAPPAGTTVGVTIGPNDYLTHFNFAFAGYFEARKENWSIFSDVLYLSLSNQGSSVTSIDLGSGPIHIDPSFNTNTSATFETFLASLAGSYTVLHKDKTTLDVFGGVQYVGASASVNWSLVGPRGMFPKSGSLSDNQELLAGIAGIKGRVQLGGGNWFIPYYLDGGAGGFTTWQGMVGIGYAFSWGDVALTYRHLYIDTGEGGLLQNINLSGPMLAVAFNF